MEEALYNFLLYIKLWFVYCTVCQNLLYIFIMKEVFLVVVFGVFFGFVFFSADS